MNKIIAVETGGIEATLKAINTHIYNTGVCRQGCGALRNLCVGNALFQKEVCKKGRLEDILRVLKVCTGNENLMCSCCDVLSAILSSPETHSRYCTPEVIRAVEGCYERHKDSEKIKQFLLSLKREEDPRVRDAVARGVCTKEAFQNCKGCAYDRGYYCPDCCVQQKAFRCFTCDKDKNEVKLYCEVCWKRDHKGHIGEELFCPVRCATNHKS